MADGFLAFKEAPSGPSPSTANDGKSLEKGPYRVMGYIGRGVPDGKGGICAGWLNLASRAGPNRLGLLPDCCSPDPVSRACCRHGAIGNSTEAAGDWPKAHPMKIQY